MSHSTPGCPAAPPQRLTLRIGLDACVPDLVLKKKSKRRKIRTTKPAGAKVMERMRNLSLRLLGALIYFASFLINTGGPGMLGPFADPPSASSRTSERTCGCEIFRAAGACCSHCACCSGGTCDCRISPVEENPLLAPELEPATLRRVSDFRLLFPSAPLALGSPHFIDGPYLPVSTPPPWRCL